MWVWPIGSISDWDVLSGAIWPSGQVKQISLDLSSTNAATQIFCSRVLGFLHRIRTISGRHLTWIFCSGECISARIELELFRETLDLDRSLVGKVTKKWNFVYWILSQRKKDTMTWQFPDTLNHSWKTRTRQRMMTREMMKRGKMKRRMKTREEDMLTETWWFLEWEYILKGLVGALRHMPWQINIYGRAGFEGFNSEFTPTQNTAQGFVFETRP